MKIKALIFGLLIAGSTALSYTATQENNEDQATTKIDKRRITKTPTWG